MAVVTGIASSLKRTPWVPQPLATALQPLRDSLRNASASCIRRTLLDGDAHERAGGPGEDRAAGDAVDVGAAGPQLVAAGRESQPLPGHELPAGPDHPRLDEPVARAARLREGLARVL